MKKKLVVVLLSAAMCVAAFGGCGAKIRQLRQQQ